MTPISVAKQVLRRGIPWESVDELLRRPASRRVSGHSKMHDAPPFMREHEEDEEHSEAGCGYDKEVGCDQIPHMVLQECLPALRGWSTRVNHVLGNASLTDLDAEFLKFPVNAWSTPPRVGEAHVSNQRTNFGGNSRTSLLRSALPGPIQPKGVAISGNYCFRLDDSQRPPPISPQA